MTPQERLDHFQAVSANLECEIKIVEERLHELLKEQHEARRQIFNAQYEVRHGSI